MGLVLGAAAFAQDVPEPASWVTSLRTAIEAGEGLTLTAEETAEMFEAIATLERQRVADVAVSDGMVYIISAGGEIVGNHGSSMSVV